MAIRDADIKLLFGKNVTVGESINENIANPSQIETGFDIRGNYSTVSMAVYCIDPSSTFTSGLFSHYFVSEAGINDQNP